MTFLFYSTFIQPSSFIPYLSKKRLFNSCHKSKTLKFNSTTLIGQSSYSLAKLIFRNPYPHNTARDEDHSKDSCPFHSENPRELCKKVLTNDERERVVYFLSVVHASLPSTGTELCWTSYAWLLIKWIHPFRICSGEREETENRISVLRLKYMQCFLIFRVFLLPVTVVVEADIVGNWNPFCRRSVDKYNREMYISEWHW